MKNAPLGVGVDIIELKRFKSIRFLSRIAELFLTKGEWREFSSHADPVAYVASRFALKEAVIKAYPGKLTYRDFEIIKIGEKPHVNFLISPSAISRMFVSLSHSTDYVAGFAVAT